MLDRVGPLRRLLASIRTRLLLTIVVVLAVGVGGTAVVTRQVLLSRVDARIDDQLAREIEELRLFAREGVDPDSGTGFGTDASRLLTVYLARTVPTPGEVLVTYVDGRPFRRTAQEVPYRVDLDPDLTARWGRLERSARGAVATPAGTFEYLAVPFAADDVVVMAGVFRDVVAAEVEETVRVTGWVAFATLLAGVLVAVGLARRILTPLEEITATARNLTDHDLSGRLDVTGHDEVAELALTFNAMLDRLERAFDRQRQLVDDAGHELRTPLTVVRGHLELLDDDASPAERDATVALVLDEVDRMHRMVEDLLTLAKVEQQDVVRPAPLDLDELTVGVHRRATALAHRHDLRLDEVGVGRVVADRQRLTQALMALVDNAVRHTPPDTTVWIGSRLGDDEVRLWVCDDGPGVAAVDRERIFERFARGTSGPRRSDGAGLGLAIVRVIAEAHGGSAELEDVPGGGSRFVLRLPIEPGESAGGRPDRPAAARSTDLATGARVGGP